MEVSVFRHIASASHRLRLRFFLAVCMVFAIALGIVIGCASTAHAGPRQPSKVTRWTPEVVRIFIDHGISTKKYLPRTLRCIHRESHGGTWANPKRKYWGLLQIDRRWSFPHDTDGTTREPCLVEPWQACGSCSIHAMAHKIRTEGIRRVQGRWRTWR
jgi:hypothetical protein